MAQAAASKPRVEKSHVYAWEGLDGRGTRIKGESRASDQALVRAELRRQGVRPLKVKKKVEPLALLNTKRVVAKDIATFSRQIATLVSAGVPVVQAMDIVARGAEKPRLQDLLFSIKADIEAGNSLASALREHPLHFDRLFCNLVAAGESAGVLDDMLNKVAAYKERMESIKGKIKKALFYPAMVIAVAVLVTAIILMFVIPAFKELFSSFGADLPAFTLLVIDISDWVQAWWWLILLTTVVAGYAAVQGWKRSEDFRRLVDRTSLRVPVLGPLFNKAAIARFARTLSTTFSAGVPMVEALESVAGATGNAVYADAILRIREDVATGQSLQLSMRQQNLFPHMVVQMTGIGEEAGALDELLARVADFYEEEVNNAVDTLSSLLEPMIMVVIGILVGGLVVAMYLPIFKMASVF